VKEIASSGPQDAGQAVVATRWRVLRLSSSFLHK